MERASNTGQSEQQGCQPHTEHATAEGTKEGRTHLASLERWEATSPIGVPPPQGCPAGRRQVGNQHHSTLLPVETNLGRIHNPEGEKLCLANGI